MNNALDDFELGRGEAVARRVETGDRLCFLQCSDWGVEILIEQAIDPYPDGECHELAERLQSWAQTDSFIVDEASCNIGLAPGGRVLDDWLVYAYMLDNSDREQKETEASFAVAIVEN